MSEYSELGTAEQGALEDAEQSCTRVSLIQKLSRLASTSPDSPSLLLFVP